MVCAASILLCHTSWSQEAKKAAPQSQNAPNEKELVFTENRVPANEEARPMASFGIWDFLRMLLVLGFVLGLVYGFFHYLKKLSAPKDTGLEFIRLLESKMLTANKQVHLLEVGGHILLVGTAENAIQLLLEVKDQETLDSIRLKASEIPAGRRNMGFSDFLKQYWRPKTSGPPEPPFASTEALDFMRKQRDRLQKLH